MVNSLRSIAGLAVLAGFANAKLYDVPEATTIFNFPLDQFSPQPTKAPAVADLRRRQASATTTVLVAPDNTCGFISGRAGAAYTCGSAANCVFFTASGRNSPGRVACCDSEECGAHRTCYDQNQVSVSSLCNDGCQVDQFTLKCTNSARPYCNTISFSGSIFDYWCNTVEISTPQAAQTTYEGQAGRSWVPLALTDNTSSSVLRPPSASGKFTGTATGSPSEPSSDGTTDNDKDRNNDSEDKKSSTPVGAIVGGVVGGVALLALIGLGIFFLLRKKPQPAGGQQPPPGQQQPITQGGYQPAPQGSPSQYAATTHTQSVYDPKYANQAYTQSYGGTPPPQAGYQQGGFYAGNNMAPDRADTTSPGAVSQLTDHRLSTQTAHTGFPGQQPQQFGQPKLTIHEAPADNDGHRGQMHELA